MRRRTRTRKLGSPRSIDERPAAAPILGATREGLGLAHESRRFNMAAKRHSRRPLRALARSSPRSARGLGIAALGGSMVALALGPTAGLADTGGVYVDS